MINNVYNTIFYILFLFRGRWNHKAQGIDNRCFQSKIQHTNA